MICSVCKVGVSFFSKCGPNSTFYVCSWRCANKFMDSPKLKNPNDYEEEALLAASDRAGSYIESLRQTNMALWQKSEWDNFIKTVVHSFQNSLSKSYNEDPPF